MKVVVNIIAVDDNKADLVLLSETLDSAKITNYKLFSFPEPFLKEVVADVTAVCIIDHLLENRYGFDIMKEVQQQAPHAYIIILSGYGDIHDIVEYVNAGAHKFVLKGDAGYLDKLVEFVKEGITHQQKLLSLKKEITSL